MAAAIFAISPISAEAKPRFISGDNYNASQFSAQGLEPTIGETIKMLIGRNVDAHPARSEHQTGHGEADGHDALHAYDQVSVQQFLPDSPRRT